MRRWFRSGGSLLGDTAVAAVALVVALVAMLIARANGWYPEDIVSYLTATTLAIASWPASRVAPRITLTVAAVVVAAPAWVFEVPEIRVLPLIVAAFGAAVHGASAVFIVPVTALAGAAGILSLPLRLFLQLPDLGFSVVDAILDRSRHILVAVVLLGVVALGYGIRSQRRVAEDLRQRNAELVALQEAERLRVAQEVRTAIARDVHDVVAHHISAMVIRAQAAARVDAGDAEKLHGALHEVAADGGKALTAMRRVVRMLRDGEARPSLDAEFADVLARVRAGGREVEVVGSVVGASEFVRAALLRIAQEALTNVMRHSDARRVVVTFSTDDGTAGVTVVDDGDSPAQASVPPGGNGIVGMTERAHASGGTLTAGPAPEGGWRVAALLPSTGAAGVAA